MIRSRLRFVLIYFPSSHTKWSWGSKLSCKGSRRYSHEQGLKGWLRRTMEGPINNPSKSINSGEIGPYDTYWFWLWWQTCAFYMVCICLNTFLKFRILGIFGLILKTGTSLKKDVPQLIQVYIYTYIETKLSKSIITYDSKSLLITAMLFLVHLSLNHSNILLGGCNPSDKYKSVGMMKFSIYGTKIQTTNY